MSKIVAQYIYRDEKGELLFVVNRCEPKDFFQTRPMANMVNTWATGLQEGWYALTNGSFRLKPPPVDSHAGAVYLPKCRIVPYHLPELLARPSHPVLIVEGEKDVEAVEKLGIVATCNPLGAGKFTDACGKYLKGRRVTIVPDKDDVGLGHAYQVAAVCLRHRAATVRVLGTTSDYWNAPGKDLSDWLATVPSVPTAKEKLIEWVKAEAEYMRHRLAA